jgi:hypothetical protein
MKIRKLCKLSMNRDEGHDGLLAFILLLTTHNKSQQKCRACQETGACAPAPVNACKMIRGRGKQLP